MTSKFTRQKGFSPYDCVLRNLEHSVEGRCVDDKTCLFFLFIFVLDTYRRSLYEIYYVTFIYAVA